MKDGRLRTALLSASASVRDHLAGHRRPEGCIIVPVPAVAPLMGEPLAPEGGRVACMPPHITVLYPFQPAAVRGDAVLDAVGAIAREVEPFAFHLVAVGTFADVVYLRPEPEWPFLVLLEAVLARWPDEQPYGGRFDRFIPHVTVAHRPEPPGLLPQLEAALPVPCRAEEMHVMVREPRTGWCMLGQAELGRRSG